MNLITIFQMCLQVERLDELFEALAADELGEAVHYSSMFDDDPNLNQGMLAETIRSQHLTERLEYLKACYTHVICTK